MTNPSFEVDLADPHALKAKLAELDEIVRQKQRALQFAQQELAHWSQLRHRLGIVAGEPPSKIHKVWEVFLSTATQVAEGVSIQAQTVAIVEQLVGPVRADDVLARLPQGTKRETVNWALWKAESDGTIQKLSQGVYASKAFRRYEDVVAVSGNESRPALSMPSDSGGEAATEPPTGSAS